MQVMVWEWAGLWVCGRTEHFHDLSCRHKQRQKHGGDTILGVLRQSLLALCQCLYNECAENNIILSPELFCGPLHQTLFMLSCVSPTHCKEQRVCPTLFCGLSTRACSPCLVRILLGLACSALHAALMRILVAGVVSSRTGLWTIDLAVSQLLQEQVPGGQLGE